MTDLEILTKAFANLGPEGLDNIAWHLEQKTEFFCGPGSESNYCRLGFV